KSYPFSDVCATCEMDLSTTTLGDTTGINVNGEYVLFRSPLNAVSKEEEAKILSAHPVTVWQYEQFQIDVRDSIATELIYSRLEMDEDANDFINWTDPYTNEFGETMDFDPNSRGENGRFFSFNRDRTFYYGDPDLIPCINDMYLPAFERFYGQKEFDKRKWNYVYKESLVPNSPLVRNSVNVINDDFIWARQAKDNNDAFGILGQLYSKGLKGNPVIGLIGSQAAAYCHWKEEQLQEEFDRKKLPYTVVVTLPTSDDVSAAHELHDFVIKARDYSNQWRISNDEYDHFIGVVQDSIIREYLYDHLEEPDDASYYLDWDDIYFDEPGMEWKEYDPTPRSRVRDLFPLNYDAKIDMKNDEVRKLVDECYGKIKKNPTFVYYQYLSMNRSVFGEFEESSPEKDDECMNMKLKPQSDESGGVPLGYDVSLGRCNSTGQSSGVRGHKDLSKFIERHEVSLERLYEHRVVPPNELDLALDVSYEQALAFYHWLYPIRTFSDDDDWQNFVYPSEEQYELILAGKSVVVPEKVIDYPSPVFRYVVHVYGK
ncbi:MAG: hypothetical protein ACI837_001310, partial [Crocinitomicaceae bacterium]